MRITGMLLLAGMLAWGSTAGADEPRAIDRRVEGSRWEQMSPEQKERVFQNFQRWKNLPPEEQEQLRERFQRFKNMTPEQKERVRKRIEVMKQLPMEKREAVRNVFRRWRRLPQDEKTDARRVWRDLKSLDPDQRIKKLGEHPFYRGMEPSERDALRELFERSSERGTPGRGRPQGADGVP